MALTFSHLAAYMIHGRWYEMTNIPRWPECRWQTSPKQQKNQDLSKCCYTVEVPVNALLLNNNNKTMHACTPACSTCRSALFQNALAAGNLLHIAYIICTTLILLLKALSVAQGNLMFTTNISQRM